MSIGRLYICNGSGKDFCSKRHCDHSKPHIRSCISCGDDDGDSCGDDDGDSCGDDDGDCCCNDNPDDFYTRIGDCDGNRNMVQCVLWKDDFLSDDEITIE